MISIPNQNKKLENELFDINADIDYRKWSINSDEDLENLKNKLDIKM